MTANPSPESHFDRSAIVRAYSKCRQITRSKARNFYYGIRLSPEPQRSALYAIYAWMRLADDLVDENPSIKVVAIEQRIASFRARTMMALSGKPALANEEHDLWLALADVARRFRIAPRHFHDMLDGQLNDAHETCYETAAQLMEYCHRVASTVGMLCVDIWGYSDSHAPQLAAERGMAFQLTNILRDVAEDMARGRVYLPKEDFHACRVSAEELRRWDKPDACHNLMNLTIERARRLYEISAPLDQMVHPSGKRTLWTMTTIYRRLLDKIASNPSRPLLGRRVRVSALRKGAIALWARWPARSPVQFGMPPASPVATISRACTSLNSTDQSR